MVLRLGGRGLWRISEDDLQAFLDGSGDAEKIDAGDAGEGPALTAKRSHEAPTHLWNVRALGKDWLITHRRSSNAAAAPTSLGGQNVLFELRWYRRALWATKE